MNPGAPRTTASRGWRDRMDALTREGRDTLWLLGVLALVMAPHAPHIPLWASGAAGLALAWRVHLALTDGRLPSRAWMTFLLAAALSATWLTHRTVLGREAGITLVVVLTTLKCLELRARRDALVCLYLGFFLILTQFFFDQGLLTAALMLLGVWGLLTSLVLGQVPHGRPPLRLAWTEARGAMLKGLPLMVVLFLLFPRLGPLWSLPADAGARTGLSNTIDLGDFSALAQDDTIALRIRFRGTAPLPDTLYFRGPTLEHFDGKTWRVSDLTVTSPPPVMSGLSLAYDMTVEPSALDMLPAPEFSQSLTVVNGPDASRLVADGPHWWVQGAGHQRLQVQGIWRSRARLGQDMPRWLLRRLTQLPPGRNPETVAWAVQQTRTHPDWTPSQHAQAILATIRREDFRYTLSPPPPRPDQAQDQVDDFWMGQRAGFCEHFASAFVVIMRAQGTPARIVTGYQGAEPNPVDGQWLVRNSHAHAWAEYWQASEGWIRIDPTAAVAPERVQPSARGAFLPQLPGPLGEISPDTLRRWRFMTDALNHRWNTWVLQYSGQTQMKLLEAAGWSRPSWSDLGPALAWALGLLSGVTTAVLWWQGRARAATGHRVAIERMDRTLRQRGWGSPPGPQPADASAWHRLLSARWTGGGPEGTGAPSPIQQTVLESLRRMDSLMYGPDAGQTSARRLRLQWRTLSTQVVQTAQHLPPPLPSPPPSPPSP